MGQVTAEEILSIIKEEHTLEDFKISACLEAHTLMAGTLKRLLQEDGRYQSIRREADEAKKKYNETEFTKVQKNVTDTWNAREYEAHDLYCANAYLAGLLDGYRILSHFDLVIE